MAGHLGPVRRLGTFCRCIAHRTFLRQERVSQVAVLALLVAIGLVYLAGRVRRALD